MSLRLKVLNNGNILIFFIPAPYKKSKAIVSVDLKSGVNVNVLRV